MPKSEVKFRIRLKRFEWTCQMEMMTIRVAVSMAFGELTIKLWSLFIYQYDKL